MAVRSSSKSGLFLIEMMVSILFLALASGVCVNLFVKAHTVGKESRDVSAAISCAQSAAETFKACDGDMQKLEQLLNASDDGVGTLSVYYDANWAVTSDEKAPYRVRIEPVSGSLEGAQITVRKTGRVQALWQLDVKKYVPST